MAMILGISEYDAAKLVKTKMSGTHTHNVIEALKNKKVNYKNIHIGLPFECIYTHLKLLSNQYPIYVSAEFISNSGKGRNSIRRHSIVINREKVYDPAENFELELDSIYHSYNRKLLIKDIILVGFRVDN